MEKKFKQSGSLRILAKKETDVKKSKCEYKIKSRPVNPFFFFFLVKKARFFYISSKYGNNLLGKVKNKVKIQHRRPKKISEKNKVSEDLEKPNKCCQDSKRANKKILPRKR